MPVAPPTKRYTHSIYIVCAGPSDAAFVRALIVANGWSGADIGCPQDTGHHGESGLSTHLKAVLSGTDEANIQTLLVIFDNESNPTKSVANVKDALAQNGFLNVPDPPAVFAGARTIAIYMLPALNQHGCLEHLLIDALLRANPPLENCINEFTSCTGHVGSWSQNYQAKMKLQALIAAHCRNNPGVPLSWIWSTEQKWAGDVHPIPLDSPAFDDLRAFLRPFLL